MMSHGSFFTGGDRDIAMTRSVVDGETLTDEGFEWNLPASARPYYRLPPYLADVPGFEDDVRAVDAADGRIDGRWRDNEIDQLLGGFDTPARIPYQQRVLETMIEREGFGADEVPDLLFANFKQIDYISHVWTMNSPEMRDAVEWQDAALRDLVRYLNRRVGRSRWVLALTADHGAIPDPAISGAFSISTSAIASGINAAFDGDGDDRPVVRLIQPTQIYLDEAELEEKGHAIEDVARWVMDLTKRDTAPSGTQVPASAAGDLVFQAAFPSELMRDLPCLPEARA
jgi:predicted AlkP superfamily pyrophosphatase or phosphodiesterase